jgi:hypothetical protein
LHHQTQHKNQKPIQTRPQQNGKLFDLFQLNREKKQKTKEEREKKIIQINQPTRCKNLSSLLLDVYLQLNIFQVSCRPSSEAQQLQ